MKNLQKIGYVAMVCLILLLGATGCRTGVERRLDGLERPVIVAAISGKGDVLLRGAGGKCLMVNYDFYMGRAIADSLGVGDILIPAPIGT